METYSTIQVFGYIQGKGPEHCVPLKVFKADANEEKGHLIVSVVMPEKQRKPKSIEITVGNAGEILKSKIVDVKCK